MTEKQHPILEYTINGICVGDILKTIIHEEIKKNDGDVE